MRDDAIASTRIFSQSATIASMLSRTAGDIVSRPSVSAAPLYSFHCSVCAWIFSLSSAFFRNTPPVATPSIVSIVSGLATISPAPAATRYSRKPASSPRSSAITRLPPCLSGAHQAMDFVRGGKPGAEARDLDHDRANVVVDRRRLERIAEMVEAKSRRDA